MIVLDENDNEPEFSGAPYKASIAEDTPVGTTVFRAIEATDRDLIGEVGFIMVKLARRGETQVLMAIKTKTRILLERYCRVY